MASSLLTSASPPGERLAEAISQALPERISKDVLVEAYDEEYDR